MGNRNFDKIVVVDATDTQIGGDNPSTSMPKGILRILAIKWVATAAKAIADTNKLTIDWEKAGGDIVIACDAQLAALTGSVIYSVEFCKPWLCPGLFIDDLDGGELQVFLD